MKKADHQLVLSSVDDDTRARKSSNNGWSCEVCGKKFSSKKSLGVHTRVHLNSRKKPPKIIEDDDSEMKVNPTCKLCGKRFPSLRSLCGHMRCHPARERRLPEKLMKSGGRENLPSSSNETELDADAYGAACAIMLIATGEERYKLSPKGKKEEAVNSKKRKGNEVFMETTVSRVSMVRHKEFLRRQAALGGHPRGSCSSSLPRPDEDGIMSRSSEEEKRVVVDVDLNELAPEYGDGNP